VSRRIVEAASNKEDHRYAGTFSWHRLGQDYLSPCGARCSLQRAREEEVHTAPVADVGMLIAWLTLIFASFGYRAPKNAVVVSMLLISSMLISASLYLILDMDIPFKGPIRISYEPYHRALNEMQEP
jgi:hypothetical protein